MKAKEKKQAAIRARQKASVKEAIEREQSLPAYQKVNLKANLNE